VQRPEAAGLLGALLRSRHVVGGADGKQASVGSSDRSDAAPPLENFHTDRCAPRADVAELLGRPA
jgi:hypothetical protein